jgi:hypothetical protein
VLWSSLSGLHLTHTPPPPLQTHPGLPCNALEPSGTATLLTSGSVQTPATKFESPPNKSIERFENISSISRPMESSSDLSHRSTWHYGNVELNIIDINRLDTT